MKIIISPSKTQDFSRKLKRPMTTPKYQNKAMNLYEMIAQLPKSTLEKSMKIKEKLLNQTYKQFQNYQQNDTNHAICSYNGFVFKEIKWEEYPEDDLNFMNQHLRILSAMYGILKPFDGIKPYRLDMKMKLFNPSLYQFWSVLNDELKNEDVILNLASDEFSQLIKTPMISIHFLVNKDGKYKNIGTYAKKARGIMVNSIIKNKITNIEELKILNIDQFVYNQSLSSNTELYFTR